MDEFEVPANVSVHKQPRPGHLSYPLQTKEIVEGLDLGTISQRFRIFYMNNRPGPTLPRNRKKYRLEGWFDILSITWYGHMPADEQLFYIGVHLCKPTYRKRINQIIRSEVFPLVRRWVKDVERLPNINSLLLEYHKIDEPIGGHKFEWGLELLDQNKHRKWSKTIDLDKKENDAKS